MTATTSQNSCDFKALCLSTSPKALWRFHFLSSKIIVQHCSTIEMTSVFPFSVSGYQCQSGVDHALATAFLDPSLPQPSSLFDHSALVDHLSSCLFETVGSCSNLLMNWQINRCLLGCIFLLGANVYSLFKYMLFWNSFSKDCITGFSFLHPPVYSHIKAECVCVCLHARCLSTLDVPQPTSLWECFCYHIIMVGLH